MGLKNITAKAEKIKYNGVEKVVAPGDVIDVRDFNINNHEVFSVENVLADKHRDAEGNKIFEQSKTLSNMTDAQINEEIARLRQELDDASKTIALSEKDNSEQAMTIGTLQSEIASLKETIEKLKEKKKV